MQKSAKSAGDEAGILEERGDREESGGALDEGEVWEVAKKVESERSAEAEPLRTKKVGRDKESEDIVARKRH